MHARVWMTSREDCTGPGSSSRAPLPHSALQGRDTWRLFVFSFELSSHFVPPSTLGSGRVPISVARAAPCLPSSPRSSNATAIAGIWEKPDLNVVTSYSPSASSTVNAVSGRVPITANHSTRIRHHVLPVIFNTPGPHQHTTAWVREDPNLSV